jgi:hypothetical protein
MKHLLITALSLFLLCVFCEKGQADALRATGGTDPSKPVAGAATPSKPAPDKTDMPKFTPKGEREFKMRPVPDFTQGGKKDDKHDWNLGPTGARGWMWGMRLRTDFARQILITSVDKGSPADGVLQPGDVILGIGGKSFDGDARIAFGNAIGIAEQPENKGILKLTRWRGGKSETAELNIGVKGSYGALAPFDCEKSQKILKDACDYMIRKGIGNGIVGHVNALGLLATGKEEYLPLIRDYARSLKVEDAMDMSSWNMGYMNIFLAEYYLVTGDKEVLPEIRQMALYFANGQDRVGTWGHGNAGKDGILLGYGSMCQPTLSVAVSLLLDKRCGIDDPVVEKAIRKTDIFFSTFVDRGSIPYGDGTPDDVHDSNGRSSVAVIFYDLLNRPEAYDYFARLTIASYGQREEGHTGNYWGFLWGPLGAMRAGPEATAAFLKEQRWFFDLERRWDGGFTYQGGADMSGSEHTTPGWDTTGARVLMYAMPLKKLYITGKGQKAKNALTGKALEETLDAGRDYSVWLREEYVDNDALDQRSADELLKKLVTWSTPMRIRVAAALARKEGDYVPVLMSMLTSKNRATMLGGIYGLEYQKQKAAPAIDALIQLLTHDDLWIRFRAGFALCAIGGPARVKAVPAILKVAAQKVPGDIREMNQRFMCFLLWGDGLNRSAVGLIRDDMSGVDSKLLVAAIRRMITNEDGQMRSYIGRALKIMPKDLHDLLWKEIIWAIRNPAPSMIMFNADIREAGIELLVKYRYREAMPICAEYVMTMKEHGCQDRIIWLMKILAAYGTEAKQVLPDLYKAREYYAKNLGPGKPVEFPQWATDKFMKGLNEGIRNIEQTTSTPTNLQTLNL